MVKLAALPCRFHSVIDLFVLLFLLEQLGAEAVLGASSAWSRSDEPFNPLKQLQNQGWPRNPMLNGNASPPHHRPSDAHSRCEVCASGLTMLGTASCFFR